MIPPICVYVVCHAALDRCTVRTYVFVSTVPIALAITMDIVYVYVYVHTVCTVLNLMASTATSVFLAVGPFLSSSPSPAPPGAGTHTLLLRGTWGSVRGVSVVVCACVWSCLHGLYMYASCGTCTIHTVCEYICTYVQYARMCILYPPNMKCLCSRTFVYYECWFLTLLCIVAAPLLLLCTADNRAKSSGQVQLHCTAAWRAVL